MFRLTMTDLFSLPIPSRPQLRCARKLGEMTRQGWCYVVVADKNGPNDYDVEGGRCGQLFVDDSC